MFVRLFGYDGLRFYGLGGHLCELANDISS